MRHRAHSASTRPGVSHTMSSGLRLNIESHPSLWIRHNDWSNFDATDIHRHRRGTSGLLTYRRLCRLAMKALTMRVPPAPSPVGGEGIGTHGQAGPLLLH